MAVAIHFPVEELQVEVSALSGRPKVDAGKFTGAPGTTLPEVTITLPRTCDLAAILLDPSGSPRRECRIIGAARYGDGKKESFSGRTDREGRLEVEGLPALPMTLWIEVEDKTAAWESGPIDGSTGKLIDLGKVVLGPSRAGDG